VRLGIGSLLSIVLIIHFEVMQIAVDYYHAVDEVPMPVDRTNLNLPTDDVAFAAGTDSDGTTEGIIAL
jgi:hypothetical protein